MRRRYKIPQRPYRVGLPKCVIPFIEFTATPEDGAQISYEHPEGYGTKTLYWFLDRRRWMTIEEFFQERQSKAKP